MKELSCNSGSYNIQGESFDISFEEPGVYFYQQSCDGFMSPAYDIPQDGLNKGFDKKIGGVKFVNDEDKGIYYGAIFHQAAGLKNGGLCSLPMTDDGSGCQTVSLANPSAVDIFKINQDPGSSGDGVDFYSEPYGQATGSQAGFYPMLGGNQLGQSSEIEEDYVEAANMCFDYTGIAQPDQYQYKCDTSTICSSPDKPATLEDGVNCSDTACESFQDCPGSIKIKGDYLVALYSASDYCQTFQNVPEGTIPDLKTEPFIASGAGGTSLDRIYVIPVQ